MKRPALTAIICSLGVALACAEISPPAPEDPTVDPPLGMTVSNAVRGELAYVSAAPGTFQNASLASVGNDTRHSEARWINLIDGGFDPVPVRASTGDAVVLTVLTNGGSFAVRVRVPARQAPVVVRMNPPEGRTAEPLAVPIVAVFSEPMDRASVTSSSISLRRGTASVSGRVEPSSDGVSIGFIPDNSLQPFTTYALEVGPPLRDLDADALASPASARFTTLGLQPEVAGLELLFSSVDDGQIYRIRLDGTGQRRITSDAYNSRPALSPDGRRIAFSRKSYREFPGADIYVMDAGGGNIVRRTVDAQFGSAEWSPDGRTLAVSEEMIYQSEIWLVPADGDRSPAVRFAELARAPAWSPDGARIAFIRISGDDGYDQVLMMNADGTAARPVTELDEAGIYGLSWSPDGERLAFSKCLAAACDVYTVRADGTDMKRVTTSGIAQGAEWSPDGEWIAFTVFGSVLRAPSIAFAPAAGGTVRVVAPGLWPSWYSAPR
jgi:TolB protein